MCPKCASIGVALLLASAVLILYALRPSTDDREGTPGSARRSRRQAEGCLWVLIAQEEARTLTSPGYPNPYPSNTDCRWLLTTRNENQTIAIRIDTLAIESDPECRLDYLRVYLGEDGHSSGVGPLCGRIENRLVRTNASTVQLVFHSDQGYEDAGFSIDYFVQTTRQEDDECRGTVRTGGWLTSPRFPDNYPDSVDCSTVIRASGEDRKVILVFDSVDLEYGDNCTFDYVQVYDGNTTDSSLLGQLCQPSDAGTFESSSDALLVRFHSDQTVNRKGFRARHSSVDRRHHSPIGTCVWENDTITSPNYPDEYPSFSNCSLWIVAPEGHRIRIHIDNVLLEIETNCSYDFLLVGETASSDVRFCGRLSEPKQLVSKGRELRIQFQSDDFVELRGFKLTYEFYKTEQNVDEEHEKSALTFSSTPQDATLPLGASHALECSTEHPNAKIRWLKDDLFLAGDSPLPGLKLLPNATLWIENMTRHLVGSYSCVAVSPEGTVRASAEIRSTDKESICKLGFRRIPSDADFEEGSFALLECLASVPEALMSWTKDGQQLPAHVTVLKNGYAFMDAIRLQDAGTYTCFARDPLTGCSGSADANVTVIRRTPIEDVCGRPKFGDSTRKNATHSDHAKIMGGHDAQKGAHPWQVMLWEPRRGSFCGATLLNERWIATAAHCFSRDISPQEVRIRLGKHERGRTEDEEVETSIADSGLIRHPDFDARTFDNDLALIRTTHRIPFTDHILPACLGDRNLTESLLSDGSTTMGTVVGWGRLKEGGALPRFLQEIKVPVVDPEVCRRSTTLAVTRNMFCAGYSQEVIGDACHGDSGGPFLVRHDDGRWYLVGVVSWGEGCGTREKYGFYTKIANQLAWIRGIIKS